MLKNAIRHSLRRCGIDIRRYQEPEDSNPQEPADIANQVMPNVADGIGLRQLIASRLPPAGRVVLLGSAADIDVYAPLFRASARLTRIEWQWDPAVELPLNAVAILCSVPASAVHWSAVQRLKARHGPNIVGIQELVLPFTPILFLQQKLAYHSKTCDEIAPFYLGRDWFGPIDRLNDLVPLRGKRVIEFGPFDGSQTAGLVHHGAAAVLCIEARAENFVKTLNAKEIFGWHNVTLRMDDMHNADAVKYGRFDLAFCHGTYYHAIAPFVLLENLVSLADDVFLGGFVLKDDAPFERLEHEGRPYRVQAYREGTGSEAGINPISYYFHPDDLMSFFSERGYRITPMDDEAADLGSNRFVRFVASRPHNTSRQ